MKKPLLLQFELSLRTLQIAKWTVVIAIAKL